MSSALIQEILTKKLVFVTGKGGIGKTLMACSLGQMAAASGLNVLIAESAAQDQLALLFGKPQVGHVESVITPRLRCINLSAAGNFREYITKYLGQKVLFESVFNHRVVKSFFNTVPGLAEIMLLGRLFYSLELSERKPDLVIFDGAASGHFHSLMTTPDAILSSGLAGPLVKETKRIRDYLADGSKCGLVAVATPEDLVVAETLDFLPRLAKVSPVAVKGVILNRMPPALDSAMPRTSVTGEDERYLAQRFERATKVRGDLLQGLAEINTKRSTDQRIQFAEVPDLGFVFEPLAEDFFKSTFFGANENA